MQNNPLTAKVALVTGAAKRVGAEIARTLHAAGMNIILHYKSSEEQAINLGEELNKIRPLSAVAIRADLQEAESDRSLIGESIKVWGRLDALINNASRFYRTTVGQVTDYAWEDLMSSNVKAPFFLSQAATPYLMETEGVIINIADIHSEKPLRDYGVYCISKGALVMMTKVLAKELGPKIRVNAISPGSIAWPEGENTLSEQEKQKIVEKTTLKRGGCPNDIAKAVLFLVRDGQYITGQILAVDGGRMLG